MDWVERVAADLGLSPSAARRTVELIDAGATIPFIAHYRREDTGGLSVGQVARMADRVRAHRELASRKEAVVQSIEEQGRLTDELRAAVEAVDTRTDLEDLFYPYRPKPTTRAQKAVESGLEPLADLIWAQGSVEGSLADIAAPFVKPEADVPDGDAAWNGARAICAERIAAIPPLRKALRRAAWEHGVLASRLAEGVDERQASRFSEYFSYSEPIASVVTHRVMALRRGEKEGLVSVRVLLDRETALAECRKAVIKNLESPFLDSIEAALEDAYDRILQPMIEGDVRNALRETADDIAIDLIAANVQDILFEPPFGARVVMGVATDTEHGFAAAVVDASGKLLESISLDQAGVELLPEAEVSLARLLDTHRPEGVAVARAASAHVVRRVIEDLLSRMGHTAVIAPVSESEAGVYANSPVGRDDYPDLEPHHRKAVSLARRMQDPMMELVKIDPRSIGSSPYHHDVDRSALLDRLLRVTTLCVSSVGVDLNHAHYRPISFIASIGPVLAKNIVTFREENQGFRTRSALHQVKKMTPTAFQQCAAYLRVSGENPLDKTAIHPERYSLVEKMAADQETDLAGLLADAAKRAAVDPSRYLDEIVGEPTLSFIRRELESPWPDPRGAFRIPPSNEGVKTADDLKPGMKLKGVITNVTDYGAFVDVGILQDGLVHASQLSHRRVAKPQDAVRIGQEVEVVVVEVDARRNRISLSIRQAIPKPEPKPRREAPPRAAEGRGPAERRPHSEERPVDPHSAPGQERRPAGDRPPREQRDGDRTPRYARSEGDRRGDGGPPRGPRPDGDRRPPRDWKGDGDRGPRPPRDDGGSRQSRDAGRGGRGRPGDGPPRPREPEGWRPFANLTIVDGQIIIKEEQASKKG